MRAASSIMLVLVLLSASALCSSAHAQDTSEEAAEEARRLFQLGSLHFDGDEFDEAAEMFERAYALDARPELALNAALAWESAGNVVAAREWFIRAYETADPGDTRDRAERGRARMDAILANMEANRPPDVIAQTLLVITSTPAGAAIHVDDVPHGLTPLELEVEPGPHTIEVQMEGFEPARAVIDVEEGTRVSVPLMLREVEDSTPILSQPAADDGRTWAPTLISASVGLAGLGVGIGFGLASRADHDQLDELDVLRDESEFNNLRDSAQSKALLSNVGYGVAIAGLVGTITFAVVQQPWRSRGESMSVAIAPWSRGMSVQLRF